MMHFAEYASPLGTLLLQSDGAFLRSLKFGTMDTAAGEEDWVLTDTKRWLDAYFRGDEPMLEIPLAPEGTEFQKRVWKMLAQIPGGATRSYGELARELAQQMGKKTMSAQAVGQAVGRNPIAILIPCHRVMGSRGELTGYAWGIDRKKWLLEHEMKQGRTVR